MRLIFLFIFSLILFQVSFAQIDASKQKKIDSLKGEFTKDSAHIYRFQKIRPYFNIDDRNTVFRQDNAADKNQNPVNFKGIQLGIIWKENSTFGLGFYAIGQNSQKPFAIEDGTISAQKSVSMNYFTFFYMYTFLEKKHFDFSLPVEIGFGNYHINWSDSSAKQVYKKSSGGIIPIGIGLQVNYYPTKYKRIGLSMLIGYRAVLDKEVEQNFNGAYYSFGLNFDLRQIYRDIKFYYKKKHYKRKVNEILKN